MLEVNGKTIIQRQLDVLKKSDVTNIAVIREYEKEKINIRNVIYYDVEDFRKGSLYSLFTAREKMDKGFILIFSDILFDQSVIQRVLKSKGDIVVVADASYSLHQHEIDKELDLIIGKQRVNTSESCPL